MSTQAEKAGRGFDVKTLAAAAALTVMLVGLFVLIGGWLLWSEILQRLHPNYAAMVPSTAFSFALIGCVLTWILLVSPRGRSMSAAIWAATAVIALIAGVDLVVILAGIANGVDTVLWPNATGLHHAAMAPGTAVCFLLAAVCLATMLRPAGMNDLLFVAAATAGLLCALVAIVGYTFDAQALYAVSIFTAMALHTALSFALLFTALLLTRPDIGWVALLLADRAGSAGARRVFPVVVLAPLALSLLALAMTNAGLFTANFRLSLLAILMMALLAGAVLRNAAIENEAESRLRALNTDLKAAIEDRELLLREVYHRVKNNLQQINALMMIEARKLCDPQAKTSFAETAKRIRALGTVHRLLISAAVPSKVSAADFLADLCANILIDRQDVTVDVDADTSPIDIDLAVTLGLLVNELVTNALKHAFPAGRAGRITVSYRARADGKAVLKISDNGIGQNGATAALPQSGTGHLIIRGLAGQLGAELQTSTAAGTSVQISIPGKPAQRARYA